jgi:peptidoglycan/LPS O-acetylase OafA/YrhL
VSSSRPRERRDLRLDGIRGIAVLLVLAYHTTTPSRIPGTDYPLLPGGWVGVDVFFVLSGYLITRLLLVELRAEGRIDVRAFFVRRVRRLLPALVVLLVAWLLVTQTGLLAVHQLGSTYTDHGLGLAFVPVVGAFTLLYNWLLAFELPTPVGMGHLWTLSVEEQFYVAWVTVFVVVAAKCARPRLVLWWLVVAGGVGSLVLTALEAGGAGASRDFAYFSSPTSGLGLLVGAAVALSPPVRGGNLCAVTGLSTIVLCALFVPDTASDLLVLGVLATCVGTAMLICGGGWVDRMLTLSWLRYAGRRSYAMYLWSSPLAYATVTWGGRTWEMDLVLLGSTLVIAELSWRLVERRFLARRPLPRATPAPQSAIAPEPILGQT